MQNGRRYNSIDLFKLIMAICVVAIHTHPLEYCNSSIILEIYESVVRLAVPFFFMASGFLMAGRFDDNWESPNNIAVVQSTLNRIVKMYVLWTIIYLPMGIYHYIDEGYSVAGTVLYYVRGFLFVGEQYNSWPLWYLLATIYALLLILLLMKLNVKRTGMLIAGLVCLILSILITWFVSYEGNMPQAVSTIQNLLIISIAEGRIFTGAFYIPLGMALYKKRLPGVVNAVLLTVGFILNVLFVSDEISSVLIAITSIGLFGLIISMNLKDAPFYSYARKMSTAIYLIHMYIWTGYYMLIYGNKTYGVDSWIVTTIVSAAVASIWLILKNRYKNRALEG